MQRREIAGSYDCTQLTGWLKRSRSQEYLLAGSCLSTVLGACWRWLAMLFGCFFCALPASVGRLRIAHIVTRHPSTSVFLHIIGKQVQLMHSQSVSQRPTTESEGSRTPTISRPSRRPMKASFPPWPNSLFRWCTEQYISEQCQTWQHSQPTHSGACLSPQEAKG